MSGPGPKRVLVLAEPESLFLPNCIAQLARLHPLVAIVEVPPPGLRVALRRAWSTFGPSIVTVLASEALARIVDRIAPHRFYSLRKVARQLGVPYERVSDLHGPDCIELLARYDPDVVFAQVSRRIKPTLLERATFWNKHCSLLPAYAGVFPVFWALLDGQKELGVTIHQMDEEFDRGPILEQASIAAEGHTFFSAYHVLHDCTPALVDRALQGKVTPPEGARGEIEPSYHGFPGPADRAAFRRAGQRFGVPFRLHAPVFFSITSPAKV